MPSTTALGAAPLAALVAAAPLLWLGLGGWPRLDDLLRPPAPRVDPAASLRAALAASRLVPPEADAAVASAGSVEAALPSASGRLRAELLLRRAAESLRAGARAEALADAEAARALAPTDPGLLAGVAELAAAAADHATFVATARAWRALGGAPPGEVDTWLDALDPAVSGGPADAASTGSRSRS